MVLKSVTYTLAPLKKVPTKMVFTLKMSNMSLFLTASLGAVTTVSIGDKSSYVYVYNYRCGPGHGVSIRSIGSGGIEAKVEEIHVENIKFVGTMFGCRIKTYQKISNKNNVDGNSVFEKVVVMLERDTPPTPVVQEYEKKMEIRKEYDKVGDKTEVVLGYAACCSFTTYCR